MLELVTINSKTLLNAKTCIYLHYNVHLLIIYHISINVMTRVLLI